MHDRIRNAYRSLEKERKREEMTQGKVETGGT
jgi:hypothetical protein